MFKKPTNLALACLLLSALWSTAGQSETSHAERAAAERDGLEIHEKAVVGPTEARQWVRPEGATELLLIPDSTEDRVMAFDPMTGDLIDPNFIPADPENLSTPIQALVNAEGDGILVSDQIEDVVYEYDLNGNFVGVFAPVGGPDTSILDNVRGMALLDDGTLLVTTASGTNADAIASFDTGGNYLGNRVANGAGGLDGPFGILADSNLFLTGDGSDLLQEFDLASGSFLQNIRAIDNFPEDIKRAGNGNFLVGNFLGSESGAVEIAPDGSLVGIYSVAGGARSVIELGNGNLLVSNDSGVSEIDRTDTLIATKFADPNGRLISRVTVPGGGGELALAISGDCPGSIDITVTGGTPNGGAAMLAGAPGSDPVPTGPCAGTGTDLTISSFLGLLTFNGSGSIAITRVVPEGACGRSLQLVDNTTCETTNAALVP